VEENHPAPKKNFAFIKSKEKDNQDDQNTNCLNSILNFKETESKISIKQAPYQAPNFDIFDSSQKEKFNETIINSFKETLPVIDMTKSKNYKKYLYLDLHQSNKPNTTSSLDEIFTSHNPQNINFPSNISGYNNVPSFTTDDNSSKNSKFLLNSENNFNYNHLGNHVEIYKDDLKGKDAFGFVSDMLKSKKN